MSGESPIQGMRDNDPAVTAVDHDAVRYAQRDRRDPRTQQRTIVYSSRDDLLVVRAGRWAMKTYTNPVSQATWCVFFLPLRVRICVACLVCHWCECRHTCFCSRGDMVGFVPLERPQNNKAWCTYRRRWCTSQQVFGAWWFRTAAHVRRRRQQRARHLTVTAMHKRVSLTCKLRGSDRWSGALCYDI